MKRRANESFQMVQYDKDLIIVTGFEDGGKGPGAKECRQLEEARK